MALRSIPSIEDLKIRRAVDADAEALGILLAEPGFDFPTETSLVRSRLFDLNSSGDCVLVAICNVRIVGMILLHRTRFLHHAPDGRISALVVCETFRRRGIGSRLVEAAQLIFQKWGCGRIEVTSGERRESAHQFYRTLGFLERPKRFIKPLPPHFEP